MSLPITVGPVPEIPAVPAFSPDRCGIRAITIERDRATDRHAVRFVPCDATAAAWGPRDGPEVVEPDAVAALLAAPDSAEKWAAVGAYQRAGADILTVAAFLMSLRE